MKFELKDNNLTLYLEGRIDTTNSAAVENEMNSIIEQNKGFKGLILDLKNFEYTSSSGLRAILRLKKTYDNFIIINCNSEVYEVFEMTGFNEIMEIHKAFKQMVVDGLPIIGKGAKGIVYRYNGDTVVKYYMSKDVLDDIKKERNLAKKAFVLGIPTALSYDVVMIGDHYGSVFELLDAKSISQCVSEDESNLEKYAYIFADLLKTIHNTKVKEEDMPSAKVIVRKWIEGTKGFIEDDDYNRLKAMVEAIEDRHTMLHMDYHSNNVLMQNGEPLLIDMDTLSQGHPIFELANIYAGYVAFLDIPSRDGSSFLGMNRELAGEFYKKFVERYFDGKITKIIENKIELLAYTRFLRHFLRRENPDMAKMNKAKDRIHELLQIVEKLDF